MRDLPTPPSPTGRRLRRARDSAPRLHGRFGAVATFVAWTAAAAGCLVLPRSAGAHAILMESQPEVQGTVQAGALPVWLRFNSRIDRARSRLLLLRPDRSQASLPLDPGDAPDRLLSHIELQSGDYVLRWQVLAVDGHITRGDVPFRVLGP